MFSLADDALKSVHIGKYYDANTLPPVLQMMQSGVADGSSELVMCAFGGVIWQLKRSLIDFEVMSMGIVRAYIPPGIYLTISSSHDVLCMFTIL